MLIDFCTSHAVGGSLPSPTPVPFCPRNEGQFCAWPTETNARQSASTRKNFIDFLLLSFLHLGLRELDELRLIAAKTDAIGFFQSLVVFPVVTQYPTNHPERTDTTAHCAVNEHWSMLELLVSELQEIIYVQLVQLIE